MSHASCVCWCQVAYESTMFITDVAQKDWGWTFEKAIWTKPQDISPKNDIATRFLPETRAFIISNDNAVVLIFRGGTCRRSFLSLHAQL